MNNTSTLIALAIVFAIPLIGLNMFIGVLKLAIALYKEKTVFKHLSITQKNILFGFAIIISPIWCPILVYGEFIYSLILNSCHCNNRANPPDIEAPVENIINNTDDSATDSAADELIVL